MLGCFEFLLLLGIIAGLLVLLGRYPSLGKILFWPLHNRRAFSNILLSAALCLGLLALLMLILASLREPVQPSAKLFLFFMFFALLLLLVWALVALIRPLISHPKETQVERPLFEDLAQLAASMTARVSRLSYKDVLLGWYLL